MNDAYLLDSGEPNIPELSTMFQRCGPVVAGGLAWLDNTRFCRWSHQSVDGRKHDLPNDPNGAAVPFDGASDMRPFVVDDIINERAAMKTTAFWHARLQPGASDDESGNYAVALLEHLIWRLLFYDLTREVELSAQYEEHYGWMVLAPRWRREIGLKKKTISLAQIMAAAQTVAQAQQSAPQGQPTAPPADGMPLSAGSGDADAGGTDPMMLQLTQLPTLIADPALEDSAVKFLQHWYESYIQNAVPADMQDRVPPISKTTVRKAVRDLRNTGSATVPIAYLAKNQPEIVALKPWDEVFIPPELTTENEIVFQIERVHEGELKSRIITDGYDPKWVELASKFKGAITAAPMEIRGTPLGIGGMTGGATSSPVFSAQPTLNNTLIEILHAVYRAADADGVPTIYCTTFHRQITTSFAKHEEVEGCGSDLPYAAGVREWWCRSITSSRGVPEKAHTTQNIIKGVLDSIIDRTSITALPPVNVYESPTGAQYRFGPAVQNYVRLGKEPKFMEPPAGQGLNESVMVLKAVTAMKDNSYGLMSEDVPAPRLQMSQGMAVARFLMTWNKAMQQMLALCRVHLDDDEFAEITGAPAGWLDAHRDDEDCFDCSLMFDVRELDSELMMKRIETMNNIALPADVLGTINRAQWAGDMVRAILGPMAAKRLVQATPDASQALRDKANLEVLKMFAGNQPNIIDKSDPTAASLLQMVQQIVMSNTTYLRNLNDAALALVAGPQAGQVVQQLGQRTPDDNFSKLLVMYLNNLKFIGVTQPENQQIGRTGVSPVQSPLQIKQQLAPPQMINAQ